MATPPIHPTTLAPLTHEQLLRAYRQMKTIREFEERLHVEIQTGEIPGFTHLYSGQEAVAVGVCELLSDADYIVSTHRGHGHCIAKGCDVVGMMKEIYGRHDGLCKGKGGSMHIADFDKGMLGANGIVGGGRPLAVGAAIACRNRGNPSNCHHLDLRLRYRAKPGSRIQVDSPRGNSCTQEGRHRPSAEQHDHCL